MSLLRRNRCRAGFSFLEVMIALLIATVGVTYLQEGIALTTMASRRQQFYDRCQRFLGADFEHELAGLDPAGGERRGPRPMPGDGLPVTVTIATRPGGDNDLKHLLEVRVRFESEDDRDTITADLVTHYTALLRAAPKEKDRP